MHTRRPSPPPAHTQPRRPTQRRSPNLSGDGWPAPTRPATPRCHRARPFMLRHRPSSTPSSQSAGPYCDSLEHRRAPNDVFRTSSGKAERLRRRDVLARVQPATPARAHGVLPAGSYSDPRQDQSLGVVRCCLAARAPDPPLATSLHNGRPDPLCSSVDERGPPNALIRAAQERQSSSSWP